MMDWLSFFLAVLCIALFLTLGEMVRERDKYRDLHLISRADRDKRLSVKEIATILKELDR